MMINQYANTVDKIEYPSQQSIEFINVQHKMQIPMPASNLSPPVSPQPFHFPLLQHQMFIQQQQQQMCRNYDMMRQQFQDQQLWHKEMMLLNDNIEAVIERAYDPPERSSQSQLELVPRELSHISIDDRYDFQLHFALEQKIPTKSCQYTYSSSLNRLFIQPNVVVPVNFTTQIPMPVKDAQIRCYLRYTEKRWRHHVVERCPLHYSDDKDRSLAGFVLRASQKDTAFSLKCPASGHYVTVFQPPAFTSFQKMFTFTCSSSCKGGINRRPVALCIALYVSGRMEGCSEVDVCISSCPGRDRNNQELKRTRKEPRVDEQSFHQVETVKRKRPADAQYQNKESKLVTIINNSGAYDERRYQIQCPPIQGKKNAKCLAHIASLIATAEGVSNSMTSRLSKRDPLILRNSGYSYFTKPTPSNTEERKFKLTANKFRFERSLSDPLAYRRGYTKINIAVKSDLMQQEVSEAE